MHLTQEMKKKKIKLSNFKKQDEVKNILLLNIIVKFYTFRPTALLLRRKL